MTTFQEILKETHEKEKAQLSLNLFYRLRDELARRLYDIESEIYGGFAISWEEIGKYRMFNYKRKAELSMNFMGYLKPNVDGKEF